MGGENTDMQDIFDKLSEQNKDTMILLAKGVKAAQDIFGQKSPAPSIDNSA